MPNCSHIEIYLCAIVGLTEREEIEEAEKSKKKARLDFGISLYLSL